MIERLQRWATGQGYRVGWGPLEVITAALADVEARHISRVLDAYTSESFSSEGAESLRARGLVSVVVVVKPRPAHSVLFELAGERHETLLPPTYFRYQNIFEEVRKDLSERGLPGAQVETLRAPLKQVASRLGLVSYGRNNVTYAPGLGSYFQLLGYLTDAGMTGPHDSVIGVQKELAIRKFLTQLPTRFEPATGGVKLHGVHLEIDEATGRCRHIERVAVDLDAKAPVSGAT